MSAFRLAFSLLTGAALYGQTSSRTFHVTTVTNIEGLHEIGALLRTVGDIQQVSSDEARFDITVRGTDAELAVATWIVKQLDTTTPQPAEYGLADRGEAINIVYAAHTPTQAGMNEVATALRAVAKVTQVFTYRSQHARQGIAFRTTIDQAPAAAWLVRQLDVAADDQNRWQPRRYLVPGNQDQVMKVDYLVHPAAQSDLNEMVTAIRQVADLPAIFTRSEPQGIAFRGSAAKVQLAEWLFQQLDVAEPDTQMRLQQHEYSMAGVADGVTHVYYLNRAAPGDVVKAIRSEVQPRMFTSTKAKALAVRGTPDVMAVADRVVKQLDAPSNP